MQPPSDSMQVSYKCGCPMPKVRPPSKCSTHGEGFIVLWPEGDNVAQKTRAPRRSPAESWVPFTPVTERPYLGCPLTHREMQVAQLVYKNAPDAAIASALDISPNTVRSHIANIASKLPRPHGAAVKPRGRIFNWFVERRAQDKPSSYVYFIQALGGGDHIKIGISVDPYERLGHLQTCSPLPLKIVGFVEAPPSFEFELHQKFAASRLHGEWFLPTDDLLAYASELFAEQLDAA